MRLLREWDWLPCLDALYVSHFLAASMWLDLPNPKFDLQLQQNLLPTVASPTNAMNCQELARRIETFRPQADMRDVARLCLLLSNSTENIEKLADNNELAKAWKEVNLRLQASADQHAAMTEELENLAESDPKRFSSEQIWILIRAIRVQSQILQLYIGDAALTV